VYAPPVVNESDADAGIQSQLVRVDRSGRILGTLGSIGNADDVQISSDQRWIAETVRSANGHISEVRRQPRELTGWSTFVSMPDRSQLTPVWSPDGSRIAFAIQPVLYHTWYLVEQAATGAAPERRLASHPDRPTRPTTWSPDGRLLLYQTWTNERWGVWWVSPNDGGEPSPVVRDTFNAVQAQLSPDGKWLAYSSDESGRREIYVEPFPRSGAKWRLSVEGGSQPRWRADGREIVYVARNALVTAVPIETTPAFRIGAPHLLFELPLAPDRRCAFCYQFAMTPDAQQFIVNRRATAPPPAPLVVLTNWQRAVPPA